MYIIVLIIYSYAIFFALFLASDILSITVRGCLPQAELNPFFKPENDVCYNLITPTAYESVFNADYPNFGSANILKIEGSFCTSDLCNSVNVCDASAARSLPLLGIILTDISLKGAQCTRIYMYEYVNIFFEFEA